MADHPEPDPPVRIVTREGDENTPGRQAFVLHSDVPPTADRPVWRDDLVLVLRHDHLGGGGEGFRTALADANSRRLMAELQSLLWSGGRVG